jgi:TetR/AcrR family transcriptional regulator
MNQTAKIDNNKSNVGNPTRQIILEAAELIFAKKGYDGATVREIAEKANIPKSNVLYYYSTKLDIYTTVLEDVLQAWMTAADSFDHYDEPVKALSHYINAKLTFSFERRSGSVIWANEIRSGAPVIQKFLKNKLNDWVKDREKKIDHWIESGALKPIKAKYLLYMIWATTQHYADYYHQIKVLNDGKDLNSDDIQEIEEMITPIILRGIGAVS